MNISVLVGLKNNLDYSQHFYKTFREIYPEVEICFVSYGSTDGTHEWLNELLVTDRNVQQFYSSERKTFSDTFNKAAEIATKDYIIFLHNDIVVAPGFLENVEKHLGIDQVVSYTTIEPPIFAGHERPGKIIRNFGISLETFDKKGMLEFAEQQKAIAKGKIEPGITFFMALYKFQFLEIGGFDNLFNPMFCEDDDLIRRLKLLDLNVFTSLDSICYHFVSKTSRFSKDHMENTQSIEKESNINFLRKWGRGNKKYDIGVVISNCNETIIHNLEPYVSNLFVDCDYSHYILYTQNKTKFDLKKRISGLSDIPKNDIVIYIDAEDSVLFRKWIYYLYEIDNIVNSIDECGEYDLSGMRIVVNKLESIEKSFISNYSLYYNSKLI